MKNALRTCSKYLAVMAIGALAGVVLGGWVGPRLLAWWAAPVVPGRAFSCEGEVRWAAEKLFRMQLYAGLTTAVIAGVVRAVLGRRRAGPGAEPAPMGLPPTMG